MRVIGRSGVETGEYRCEVASHHSAELLEAGGVESESIHCSGIDLRQRAVILGAFFRVLDEVGDCVRRVYGVAAHREAQFRIVMICRGRADTRAELPVLADQAAQLAVMHSQNLALRLQGGTTAIGGARAR